MRLVGVLALFLTAVGTAAAQQAAGTANAPREPGLNQQVRLKLSAGDFDSAEAMVDEARRAKGDTGEAIEGLSWLARGALYMKEYEVAEKYATETRSLALEALKKTTLAKSQHLEAALGASIEVQSQAEAAQGHREQAVKFLHEELKRWEGTALETRLWKNLNQLSIEKTKAPPIEGFAADGHPVMVFLWAHWCGDCGLPGRYGIARLLPKYKDLRVVAPTQLYGYIGRRKCASRQGEGVHRENLDRGELWGSRCTASHQRRNHAALWRQHHSHAGVHRS